MAFDLSYVQALHPAEVCLCLSVVALTQKIPTKGERFVRTQYIYRLYESLKPIQTRLCQNEKDADSVVQNRWGNCTSQNVYAYKVRIPEVDQVIPKEIVPVPYDHEYNIN